jgi:molybdate transport system substrate-binding protein
MKTKSTVVRLLALFIFSLIVVASGVKSSELNVMTSGGFTAAYRELVPEFERKTGHKIITAYGASMGNAPDSIPSRLQRGEPADLVILASSALDELVKQGRVVSGSRVDLAESIIGMAVRAGAPKPDISTVEAFKRTLLSARSIVYSDSASGVYLSTELFPRLGIADKIRSKCKRIQSEMVGSVVARGDAEIGFQQMSELLPISGITIVGPLPPAVQRVTVFSGGVTVGARQPEIAAQLLRFFASEEAARAIERSGLRPFAWMREKLGAGRALGLNIHPNQWTAGGPESPASCSVMDGLALRLGDRQARNGDRLAPQGLSPLWDLEKQTRSSW